MIRIGLVLSGGGARGFAQIGVLKILKKHNIQIDSIAASSIGSVIGACYAHNQNPIAIEKLLLDIKSKKDVYDYTFSTKGLINGRKFEEYITKYFSSDIKRIVKFEDLSIPLVINATDIVNQKEKVFDKGPLIPAVMASLSYPGFFKTKKIEDHIYVDGAIINPLPFDLLENVDYIIMVDVSKQNIKINENSNFKDIILQSTWTMQKTIVDKRLEQCNIPHIVIKPEIEYHGVLEFDNLTDLTSKGEKEAEKQIDKIKKDIAEIESKKNK